MSESGKAAGWSMPGSRDARRPFTWNRVLWALVFPQRRHRTMPTISGVLLIALAFGVGTAAYNAANNILFITLSLLLACLILSGVLSWLNFRGVDWRLELSPPWRAGQEAAVALRLRNGKRTLPTYGLWFEVVARAVERGQARAETTFTARSKDVREALARAEQGEAREKLWLRTRLDPGGEARLEWIFKPARRGRLRVELESVGSLFPFGFLAKSLAAALREEAVVWPAPVEYRRLATAAARRVAGGERAARAGSGSDLLALRRYEAGDSHRLIHWKASARTRQLLVRQFAAESEEAFALWLRTDAGVWVRPEQFELLVSFCATLAEDLFRAGKLTSAAVNDEPPTPVRRVRDLEAWLDRLAVVEAVGERQEARGERVEAAGARRNVITFAPDGPRGVAAFINGERMAAA